MKNYLGLSIKALILVTKYTQYPWQGDSEQWILLMQRGRFSYLRKLRMVCKCCLLGRLNCPNGLHVVRKLQSNLAAQPSLRLQNTRHITLSPIRFGRPCSTPRWTSHLLSFFTTILSLPLHHVISVPCYKSDPDQLCGTKVLQHPAHLLWGPAGIFWH
jgi:hypothetical protein